MLSNQPWTVRHIAVLAVQEMDSNPTYAAQWLQ